MKRTQCLLTALCCGAIAISPAAARTKDAAASPVEQSAQRTLREMQQLAAKIKQDASAVQESSLGGTSLHTQSLELRLLADDINKASKDLALLEGDSAALPMWEAETVAGALPILKEEGQNAQRAIDYQRKSPQLLWTAEYRSDLTNALAEANHFAKEIDEHLKLQKLENKASAIRDGLSASGE
jgi:hypothetical protein